MPLPAPLRRLALAAALSAPFALGCQRDMRTERIDHLQTKLLEDRPALKHQAETSDPARADLVAAFVDSSIVQYRETANPKRPFVAYVRIKWHFTHKDGRDVGDAVFDYVYALDPQEHWTKADDAADAPVPGAPASKPRDGALPASLTAPKPA